MERVFVKAYESILDIYSNCIQLTDEEYSCIYYLSMINHQVSSSTSIIYWVYTVCLCLHRLHLWFCLAYTFYSLSSHSLAVSKIYLFSSMHLCVTVTPHNTPTDTSCSIFYVFNKFWVHQWILVIIQHILLHKKTHVLSCQIRISSNKSISLDNFHPCYTHRSDQYYPYIYNSYNCSNYSVVNSLIDRMFRLI